MKDEFELTHSNGIYIPHLSASTINSFITNRAQFYNSKVLRAPFKGNQFTARGTAVEHGINVWIENPDEGDILSHVYSKFDEECAQAGLSKIAAKDVRDSLKGLLEVALKFYKSEFSTRTAITQHKFEYKMDGVTRPIIGYLDFYQFEYAVRDSKVVSMTPSALSQNYILQGALYRAALGVPVYFDYFVANKTPVQKTIAISDDDYVFGINYMRAAAQCIEKLEECDDPKEVMRLMSFPNLGAMYGNKKEMAEAAKQWGFSI